MKTQQDIDDALRDLFGGKRRKRYYAQNQQQAEPRHEPEVGIEEPITRNGNMSAQPPKEIRTRPKGTIVICKMQQKTVKLLKSMLTVAVFASLGIFFMNMPADPTALLANPMFMPMVMIIIAVFFVFKFLSNQLVWQIEIIKNVYKPRKQKEEPPNIIRPIEKEQPVTQVVHKDNIKESVKEEPRPIASKETKKESLDYSPALMNTKAVSYMIAIIGLVVFKLILIWTIDVSISGLLTSASLGGQALASNGFYLQDPAKLYHLALYCLVITIPLDTYITMKIMQTNRGIKKTKAKLPLPQLMKNPKALTTFGMAGNILAIPFVIMVMIFLTVAWTSGTGITIVYWNHFGEMIIETVLFSICAVIIFAGAYVNFKRWRKGIKG